MSEVKGAEKRHEKVTLRPVRLTLPIIENFTIHDVKIKLLFVNDQIGFIWHEFSYISRYVFKCLISNFQS